jgi:hypothetical protein
MTTNIYALVLLGSGITTLALSPVVWHRKLVQGAKWFSLLLVSVGLWCVTYAFEILSASPSAKLNWINIEYIAIVSLAPLWLMFSLTYTHRDKCT